jgi:predicted transcriptional regulator
MQAMITRGLATCMQRCNRIRAGTFDTCQKIVRHLSKDCATGVESSRSTHARTPLARYATLRRLQQHGISRGMKEKNTVFGLKTSDLCARFLIFAVKWLNNFENEKNDFLLSSSVPYEPRNGRM